MIFDQNFTDITFIQWFIIIFNAFVAFYVVLVAITYTVLTVIGWRAVSKYARRRPLRDYDRTSSSELSTPVAVLVPAYNEEVGIVASVQSLLLSNFQNFEIIVINDGSTDRTMDELRKAFDLMEVPRVPRSSLETKPVRAIYMSMTDKRVIVIDKENGGKSDALNAGINYTRYPLFCSIDADTIIDPDAVARLVWEFQAEPKLVAVGGIVRVANGSMAQDGRLVSIRTPKDLLANIQIVEYLRAFLAGRVGWSDLEALVIISGAFGVFRRQAVLEAGGYDANTVGEDIELVVRLHAHCRELNVQCKIKFVPDPVCWTEVPSTFRVLARQRDRWQRGLAQTLWKHRYILRHPRQYGRMATIALPYFWMVELIGPFIQVIGYITVPLAYWMGLMPLGFALLLIAITTVYATLLSMTVVLLEESKFRRYPNWSDVWRMLLSAVSENFGYQQVLAFVRVRAMLRMWRGNRHHWGDMQRQGVTATVNPAAESLTP